MLTPQQIADLRSDKNVRGGKPGRVLYAVSVKWYTFERAQQLTNRNECPVVWYYSTSDGQRASLLTDKPEWFVELEWKMDDARRPQGR